MLQALEGARRQRLSLVKFSQAGQTRVHAVSPATP